MFASLILTAALVAQAAEDRPDQEMLRREAIAAEAFYRSTAACLSADLTLKSIRNIPVNVGQGQPITLVLLKFDFGGCHRSGSVNLQATRDAKSGRWIIVRRLPGESNADAALQSSALDDAVRTAASGSACKPALGQNVEIGETSIQAPGGSVAIIGPGDPAPSPPRGANDQYTVVRLNDPALVATLDAAKAWQERWPIRVCGHSQPVTVFFAPEVAKPGLFFIMTALPDRNPE